MENYEQKYKEALERAREELGSGCFDRGTVEYIFPELKESEDEKIRKEIIFFFEQEIPQCSIEEHKEYMRKWISWLEKQKPSDEALQYLKENHSPSEISDFQAAMNIDVAKAFDAGKKAQKPVDVLKKKENKLPKTWEKFCENYPIKKGETSVDSYCSTVIVDSMVRTPLDDKNYLPSKDLAESMLALCQLIQLRDCYNQGWKPDWTAPGDKYCISNSNNKIEKGGWCSKNIILTFKTKALRDEFYNNFKELIEIAKPLL